MGKLRPLGSVTQDIEPLLEEMVDGHELQVSEILHLVWSWLVIHRPDSVEEYIEDGSSPIFYGPKSKKKAISKYKFDTSTYVKIPTIDKPTRKRGLKR